VAVLGLAALAAVGEARAAPDTTITAGPSGRTGDSSPSFTFAATDPNASFECSLDGSGFSPCTSPKAYAGVTESPHTFAVRAINADGEPDPTPAERNFIADASVDATVSAARIQTQAGSHIQVAVRIETTERLRALAKGKIDLEHAEVDLKPDRERVEAGRTVLRLRPAAPDGVKVARALAQTDHAKAHVRVALTDALGNELTVPVSVALRAG
jgi:hypothetical protein